jgi:hypothetical protein
MLFCCSFLQCLFRVTHCQPVKCICRSGFSC